MWFNVPFMGSTIWHAVDVLPAAEPNFERRTKCKRNSLERSVRESEWIKWRIRKEVKNRVQGKWRENKWRGVKALMMTIEGIQPKNGSLTPFTYSSLNFLFLLCLLLLFTLYIGLQQQRIETLSGVRIRRFYWKKKRYTLLYPKTKGHQW